MLAATHADGVMIGRAALGAPWLPGVLAEALAQELADEQALLPDLNARLQQLCEQVQLLQNFYGPAQGLRIARKHAQWCLTHESLAQGEQSTLAPFAKTLVRINDAAEQLDFLHGLTEHLEQAA